MEDEETGVDYNSMGFKNKSVDKINGQVQAMSGVTGTAPTRASKMSGSDAAYFKGMEKFTRDRPSSDFGGGKGFQVKQALKNQDYATAASLMKEMKNSKNPKERKGFEALNQRGISSSGFSRGGRFGDKKGTMTGEVIKTDGGGYSRTDTTFDPKTQKNTKTTYKFDE